MALSMFLRAPVCTNQAFSKQIMRLATFSATNGSTLTAQTLPSIVPLKKIAVKTDITPITNSVRSFRTSAVRMSDETPHDHSKLWVIEKGVSALMVPLIPLGLLVPNKLFDSILAILITAHSFWGMEALVVEYVRVLLFGPQIPKIAMGFVYFFTVLLLGGLFFLNLNDIGMCRAFWRIWRNMKKPREAIAVDYVRASVVGPIIPKIAIALVYLLSIATLGGLFYIISHDVGIGRAVRQLWAVKSNSHNA